MKSKIEIAPVTDIFNPQIKCRIVGGTPQGVWVDIPCYSYAEATALLEKKGWSDSDLSNPEMWEIKENTR